MENAELRAFAYRWLRDWNAHDLDAILGHFADDVLFTSPTAAKRVPASGGVIRGKTALREYWAGVLMANPDLHFEFVAAYTGVNTLVINYRNPKAKGGLVSEALIFDGPLVVEGHATHLAAGDLAAEKSTGYSRGQSAR